MQSCEVIYAPEICEPEKLWQRLYDWLDESLFGDLLAVVGYLLGCVFMVLFTAWMFAGWLVAAFIGRLNPVAGVIALILWLYCFICALRGP